MSIIKSIITSAFLPSLHVQPSRSSKTRAPSSFATSRNHGKALFWDNNGRSMNTHYKNTRRLFVRSVVGPGAPMPPEPPINFLNWIVGIAFTVVLPFFTNKWASLLRIKNEVETAVEMAEDIVEVVEMVTERVEKAAEDMLDDLPADGRLRKAVDFVEHIAERANMDAHIVGDFIDKVQEVEEEVEECIESISEEASTHKHHHKEEDINGEDDDKQEPTKLEGNIDGTHNH
ncbi:hypothetical protein ACS0TY_028135 [Phlomoides rotata]